MLKGGEGLYLKKKKKSGACSVGSGPEGVQ